MNRVSGIILLLATSMLLSFGQVSRAGPYLLVNGQSSENVVRIDLGTGTSSLFATYQPHADPRNLAMDAAGNLYSSLNGGNLNVVKLVPQPGTDVLGTVDFTPNIGGDGPGQIQFYNGDLYVAGDESRVIFRYDGTTGQQKGIMSATVSYNIRAMAIAGDTLYYEEAFQNRVRETDLSQHPTVWTTLLQDPVNLAKAINMTIGPQGTLVFANANSTQVPMYTSDGSFLGILADIKAFDSTLTGTWGVVYSPALNEYFVSAGSEVFELNTSGALVHTYTSPLLSTATGILVVPEPSSLALMVVGALGLAALAIRRRVW